MLKYCLDDLYENYPLENWVTYHEIEANYKKIANVITKDKRKAFD